VPLGLLPFDFHRVAVNPGGNRFHSMNTTPSALVNLTPQTTRLSWPCASALSLALLIFSLPAGAAKSAADYANPMIGTSNSRWMLGPYACVPFGMVQLGPDNQGMGWMSGYEASINSIAGFSHLHAWTMAGLRLMPTTTDFTLEAGAPDAPFVGAGAGYHSRFLKETERAAPGYYGVHLFDADVKAEMTATTRCGFSRYTFPQREESRIMIALQFPTEYNCFILDAVLRRVSATEIEGYAKCGAGGWFTTTDPGWNEFTLHFVIQFDKPMAAFNGWRGKVPERNVQEISGAGDVGAFVTFKTKQDEVIHVRTALSLVDLAGARKNLQAELAPFGWDFAKAVAAAKARWNDVLGRVRVEGGSERDQVKFYSNLYRAYCAKQTWNDVDGRYVDPKEQVRQLPPGRAIYGGDAFWNSFWNLNGVWSLLTPDIMNNWVVTQLELFETCGWTSDGPTGLEFSGIMDTSHETALLVAAYQKGIRQYDAQKLYAAVHHTVTRQGEKLPFSFMAGNLQLNVYREKGYVPYDLGRSCWVMDYAYDDYCVAQLAQALGKDDDARLLLARSRNWTNLFHPELKYPVPRNSAGEWLKDFNPFSGFSWTEGNAWQYTFYVPHDVAHLVGLLGRDDFNARLEHGFERAAPHRFAAHVFDRTQKEAFEFYVNHGNEANMQAAYLFNHSGQPWLAQKYARAIMDTYYGDTPYRGWEGDEDEGQMGAWFVMSALGLFEMNGGVTPRPIVELGSPLFQRITIALDPNYYSGKQFVIEARNNSATNIYIQSAKLNGKPLTRPWFYFDEITRGGKLELVMGHQPNPAWGSKPEDAPPDR